ncbi:MAG: alkaline phosphatase D family protein [Chitinophagales bacterium]|nr:alkaline phosphatase family protein [Chitinophagales bacterium]MDW8274426.1 alkaline phosphatase D family protein [Chitinophagales bacterium]
MCKSAAAKVLSVLCFYILCNSCLLLLYGQKSSLLAGPVVGSVTPTSAAVWIGYYGSGRNALVLLDTIDKKILLPTSHQFITNKKRQVSLIMYFQKLVPGRYYRIFIEIEGWGRLNSYGFSTPEQDTIKDFSFLLGSCLMLRTGLFRIAYPGLKHGILKKMQATESDFMLWLGDNVYMLWRDHNSYENMFKRYMKTRSHFRSLKGFLPTRPHVAAWDDHDYGPNDADGSWKLKDTALLIFKSFWPNPYPDNPALVGNFFKYSYYDADFFVTDDRYYRGACCDSTQPFLGEIQMLWLKQQLMTSQATFKFIVIGTQALSEMHFGEKYANYAREREELLDFIASNNIQGVVFLSGDVHFTELCNKKYMGYPFYDFSCSPLLAPVLPLRLVGMHKNPMRVEGTAIQGRNFGRITIYGNKGDRVCRMEAFDRRGKLKWKYEIHQNDLAVKP